MQGTPAASDASDTGLTVSGVEVASMRSTFGPWIRSLATWAATDGVDWPSLLMISTEYFLPPIVSPSTNALRARLITYGSGSPNPAAAPVIGLTKPILIAALDEEDPE